MPDPADLQPTQGSNKSKTNNKPPRHNPQQKSTVLSTNSGIGRISSNNLINNKLNTIYENKENISDLTNCNKMVSNNAWNTKSSVNHPRQKSNNLFKEAQTSRNPQDINIHAIESHPTGRLNLEQQFEQLKKSSRSESMTNFPIKQQIYSQFKTNPS